MRREKPEMPQEKRRAVLDAAVREFADRGYEKGSTNRIIQESGISKGLLFHYFGTKKNLFLAALDDCLDFSIRYYYEHLPELSSDLSERLLQANRVKFRMFHEHPDRSRFLMAAFVDPTREIRRELEVRRERLGREHWGRFFEGIDYSRFREDIDPQKGMELFVTVLESIGEKYLSRFSGEGGFNLEQLNRVLDGVMKEMEEYLKILRYGLYRKEEKNDAPAD
ncbi:TetR/AcrR family transcriptional regulator [Salinithrix halophila]|uniref:TetR/AcrR family transcriptional regulator n=1 Tax=Salinithrix halophila TaxID=1485204 RepID=A0ABV8JHC7_9BACL